MVGAQRLKRIAKAVLLAFFARGIVALPCSLLFEVYRFRVDGSKSGIFCDFTSQGQSLFG
jgi:hypothetical protein